MDYSSNDHNSTASLAVNIMNFTVNERLLSDKSTDIHNNISSQDDITSIKARLMDFDTNNYGLYIRLGYGDLSDLNTQMMIALISTGAMLLSIIGYLFVRQIPSILQNTPSKYQSRTIILCGIYSVTASAALVSLIVYRAAVLCDSIAHFAFVMGAYQYFTLVIDYYGGESEFIKHTNGLKVFNIQTPPCCCCLHFLLPSELTKNKFKWLRIMVVQMSIIQGLLLFLLNVLNMIDPRLYNQMYPFFVPFIVASILTGVWAIQICSRMIAKYLPNHRIMQKYFAIQLVVICYKFQPAILQIASVIIESVTNYRIQSKVIENAIIQLLILIETVGLAVFASRIYTVPNNKDSN